MIKVLHNNSCSKSRAILEYLDENNIQFEIIDLVEDPLSESEIRTLLKKLGAEALEITRTSEPLYEQLKSTVHSEDDLIKILAENPALIQRPILIKGAVAMVGRPVENVKFFME